MLGFLFALFLAGCALPSAVPTKTVPPEQQRAFDAGMRSFYDREFDRAIAAFETFLRKFPESPLTQESSWMRARSAEEKSSSEAALRYYRTFIKEFPLSRHQREAEFRVRRLKNFIAQGPAPDNFPRRVGWIVDEPHGLSGRLPETLKPVRLSGEQVLIIPAAGREGVYFKTPGIPLVEPLLPDLVSEARSLGWEVWASIRIRRIPGFPASRSPKESSPAGIDLFDPKNLERLEVFFENLTQTGVDGIVIDDDPLYEPFEGFSGNALRAFKKQFGFSLNPGEMANLEIPAVNTGTPPDDSILWKTAGWRSRETMKRIEKLILRVREKLPFLVWSQRISPGALMEPHTTLVHSGEDLVQSLQSGIDYLIVPFSFRGRKPDPYAFLRKSAEVLADQRRMILVLPPDERDWVMVHEKDLPPVGFFFPSLSGLKTRP